MTLQYRIRSKSEDESWRQRVYLCEQLINEACDQWFRTDEAFPVQDVIAGVLFIFSPRCSPYELGSYRLLRQLQAIVLSSEEEYRLTWPNRDESLGAELIGVLTDAFDQAMELWANVGNRTPPINDFVERLVGEIVARKYVVFRHYQTTRRDLNHWGI